MCPICWISGFIAVLFGGSFIATVNHPIPKVPEPKIKFLSIDFMVGFCPGPAISSLALLNTYSVFFVLSMLGGFLFTELVNRAIIRRS